MCWRTWGAQMLWCQRQHLMLCVLKEVIEEGWVSALVFWETGQTYKVHSGLWPWSGHWGVQDACRAGCAQGDSDGTWTSHKIHYRFPCPPDPSHLMYTGDWESMAVGTVLEVHLALQWGVQTTFSPTRLKTETWMCTESLQNSSIIFTLFATILGPLPGLVWTTLLFSWITWVAALPKCCVTRAWAVRCAWFVFSTTLDGHKPTHKQILLQYQGLRACKCVCA